MTVDEVTIKIYINEHETLMIKPKVIRVANVVTVIKVIENVFTFFGLTVTNWEVVDKLGETVGSKYGKETI